MNNGKLPLIPTARERMIHSHKTGCVELYNKIASKMDAKVLEYHKAFVEWASSADRQGTTSTKRHTKLPRRLNIGSEKKMGEL